MILDIYLEIHTGAGGLIRLAEMSKKNVNG